MKKLFGTMLLGALLTTTACKKKDDAAKADDKPSGELTAATYESENTAMMDKAIALFSGADKDCDKAAASVSKFFDDNKAEMERLMAFEKAHPDVKKSVEDKNKDKMGKFMESAGKVMETCKDNKAMQEAVKKMPG